MNDHPQRGDMLELPNPQATAQAKKAALINISLALIQLDAHKVHNKAQAKFGDCQTQAATILNEVLGEYVHAEQDVFSSAPPVQAG